MAKNKRRKKKGTPQKKETNIIKLANRHFKEVEELTHILNCDLYMPPNQHTKILLYYYHIEIPRVQALDDNISKEELKYFEFKGREFYYEKVHEVGGNLISPHQIMLFQCILKARAKYKLLSDNDENDPTWQLIHAEGKESVEIFHSLVFVGYYRIVQRENRPDKGYYRFQLVSGTVNKLNRFMTYKPFIGFVEPQKIMIEVNGIYRPAFRVMFICGEEIRWLRVSKRQCKGLYRGNRKFLRVYIQSHAMDRFEQRLAPLDQKLLNVLRESSVSETKNYFRFKGAILIPVNFENVTVGYFNAKIVDDILLVTTFLFVTHNRTPEGEKLKEITMLSKHEIKYWKMDRLKTFLEIDVEGSSELKALFDKVGISDLFSLREQLFDVDDFQRRNLSSLIQHVKMGIIEHDIEDNIDSPMFIDDDDTNIDNVKNIEEGSEEEVVFEDVC